MPLVYRLKYVNVWSVMVGLITAMSLSACDDQPTVSQTDTIKKPLVMEAKLPSTAAVIEWVQLTPKQTVTIKGHQILSKSCDLTGQSIRFELSDSHRSLDCQGAQLSPSADDSSKTLCLSVMVFARLSPIVKPSRWTHQATIVLRIINFFTMAQAVSCSIATALSMLMTRRAAIISNALSRVVTILFAVMFFKMSQWACG